MRAGGSHWAADGWRGQETAGYVTSDVIQVNQTVHGHNNRPVRRVAQGRELRRPMIQPVLGTERGREMIGCDRTFACKLRCDHRSSLGFTEAKSTCSVPIWWEYKGVRLAID